VIALIVREPSRVSVGSRSGEWRLAGHLRARDALEVAVVATGFARRIILVRDKSPGVIGHAAQSSRRIVRAREALPKLARHRGQPRCRIVGEIQPDAIGVLNAADATGPRRTDELTKDELRLVCERQPERGVRIELPFAKHAIVPISAIWLPIE